jgi:cyanate permease
MLAWRKGFYGYLVAAIAFLAYLLAGGSYYSLSVLTPAMLLNYFGNRHFAVLMGIATPIGSVLGTISPLLVGSIKDSSGSYVPAFVGMAILTVIGAATVFLALPPTARNGAAGP